MAPFTRLIRFSSEDGRIHFADAGSNQAPAAGLKIKAYSSFEDLKTGINGQEVTIAKLLAPTPNPELPIYCAGGNYKAHVAEGNFTPPKYPPLWTKPKACLADPDEGIPINKFCAESRLDYEGELVFMTSAECRDITPEQATSYILGYTAGNDLSCRKFQHPTDTGGQFFFAKAFDKFAPMGPTLLSAEELETTYGGKTTLTTRVNGEQRQHAECPTEFVFNVGQILSHMSQGTTIPAYTAVMTGTPSGVGWFKNGGVCLEHGDVVEVEVGGVGVLKNKMVFV